MNTDGTTSGPPAAHVAGAEARPVRVSVVVPCLDEARRLPHLLRCLAAQTRPVHEVVVADAGSRDGTRELALAAGARVVQGGMPAAGRNAGARAADGDLLLFVDADVHLAPDFVERAVREFTRRDLVAATCAVAPLEPGLRHALTMDAVNLYLDVMQYLVPHAPGFCILVRHDVFRRTGGFDEHVLLAEDHDLVGRAARLGRFRVLRDVEVTTSMRRVEKEGLVQLAFKYLYCELHVVTGRPITQVPFSYDFAAFDEGTASRTRAALARLRARFADAGETAVTALGSRLERLRVLAGLEAVAAATSTPALLQTPVDAPHAPTPPGRAGASGGEETWAGLGRTDLEALLAYLTARGATPRHARRGTGTPDPVAGTPDPVPGDGGQGPG